MGLGVELSVYLHPGGILVLGAHETLPDDAPGLTVWNDGERIYRNPRVYGEREADRPATHILPSKPEE